MSMEMNTTMYWSLEILAYAAFLPLFGAVYLLFNGLMHYLFLKRINSKRKWNIDPLFGFIPMAMDYVRVVYICGFSFNFWIIACILWAIPPIGFCFSIYIMIKYGKCFKKSTCWSIILLGIFWPIGDMLICLEGKLKDTRRTRTPTGNIKIGDVESGSTKSIGSASARRVPK